MSTARAFRHLRLPTAVSPPLPLRRPSLEGPASFSLAFPLASQGKSTTHPDTLYLTAFAISSIWLSICALLLPNDSDDFHDFSSSFASVILSTRLFLYTCQALPSCVSNFYPRLDTKIISMVNITADGRCFAEVAEAESPPLIQNGKVVIQGMRTPLPSVGEC